MGCAGLLATGCASARPTAGPATGQAQRKIAAGYMAIARPANRRLETDLEGIEHRDRNHLAAAKADLRDAAATERLFDRQLLAMRLPPATEAVARLLVASNETRAKLTSKASASTSLRQLHRYERRLEEANQPVEQAVRTIRRQLGLPPPATS
jgi:CRP-like cAMP-binding protein